MSKAVSPLPTAAPFTAAAPVGDPPAEPMRTCRTKPSDSARTSQGAAAPRKQKASLPAHVALPDAQAVKADVRKQTRGQLKGKYPSGTDHAISIASKLLDLRGKP